MKIQAFHSDSIPSSQQNGTQNVHDIVTSSRPQIDNSVYLWCYKHALQHSQYRSC